MRCLYYALFYIHCHDANADNAQYGIAILTSRTS